MESRGWQEYQGMGRQLDSNTSHIQDSILTCKSSSLQAASTLVSDLIDQDTKGWNGQLITTNFTKNEAVAMHTRKGLLIEQFLNPGRHLLRIW